MHLAGKSVAWASLNQTVAALRFFYGVTLGQAEIPERIAYAREPRRLPVVLSADEVVRFLEEVPSLKARTALTTAYAAGVSEVTGLRVGDIDSGRMLIRIEHGKGGKERYASASISSISASSRQPEPAASRTTPPASVPLAPQPRDPGRSRYSVSLDITTPGSSGIDSMVKPRRVTRLRIEPFSARTIPSTRFTPSARA